MGLVGIPTSAELNLYFLASYAAVPNARALKHHSLRPNPSSYLQ